MSWLAAIFAVPLFVAVLRHRSAVAYGAATLALVGAALGGASASALATLWISLLILALLT